MFTILQLVSTSEYGVEWQGYTRKNVEAAIVCGTKIIIKNPRKFT
jgi:hypothetical protein